MCIRGTMCILHQVCPPRLHLTLGIFIVHIIFFFTMVVCINEFFAFYRSTFPESTVTTKLHILEDHVVPFSYKQMESWIGDDVWAIHARFNTLERTYCGMPDKLQRLKCIVLEHLQQVCPANTIRQPTKQMKESEISYTCIYLCIVN